MKKKVLVLSILYLFGFTCTGIVRGAEVSPQKDIRFLQEQLTQVRQGRGQWLHDNMANYAAHWNRLLGRDETRLSVMFFLKTGESDNAIKMLQTRIGELQRQIPPIVPLVLPRVEPRRAPTPPAVFAKTELPAWLENTPQMGGVIVALELANENLSDTKTELNKELNQFIKSTDIRRDKGLEFSTTKLSHVTLVYLKNFSVYKMKDLHIALSEAVQEYNGIHNRTPHF